MSFVFVWRLWWERHNWLWRERHPLSSQRRQWGLTSSSNQVTFLFSLSSKVANSAITSINKHRQVTFEIRSLHTRCFAIDLYFTVNLILSNLSPKQKKTSLWAKTNQFQEILTIKLIQEGNIWTGIKTHTVRKRIEYFWVPALLDDSNTWLRITLMLANFQDGGAFAENI